MKTKLLLTLSVLLFSLFSFSQNLTLQSGVFSFKDTTFNIQGNFIIKNANVTFKRCKINIILQYDQQYQFDVLGNSNVILDSTFLRGVNYQTDMHVRALGAISPTVNVINRSWCTMHSGFDFFNKSVCSVNNSNIEEVQVHDSAKVMLKKAAAYPVMFFPPGKFKYSKIIDDTLFNISKTIAIPNKWQLIIDSSSIGGYQYDLFKGDTLTLDSCSGVVLSIHTPGNLPKKVTASGFTVPLATLSGSVTNLGPVFKYNSTEIVLLNVYARGTDTVHLENISVNELESRQKAIVSLGNPTIQNTDCYFNLMQADSAAQILMNNVKVKTISGGGFASLTISDISYLQFVNMNLASLSLVAQLNSTVCMVNCTNNTDPLRFHYAVTVIKGCQIGVGLQSFEKNNELQIVISPNPAIDNLKIEFASTPMSLIKTEVIDVLGKVILQEQQLSSANSLSVNVKDLSPGMYFLKVTNGKEHAELKFIKQF